MSEFVIPNREVAKLNWQEQTCDGRSVPGSTATDAATTRAHGFFRDPSAWAALKDAALPSLREAAATGRELRAWILGCASGEEAYSLAILLCEALDEVEANPRAGVRIFGTDLDRNAIATARRGWYPASIAADVAPARLARFFLREDEGYRIRREVRELLTFGAHDLRLDPPFIRLDLVSCRKLPVCSHPVPRDMLAPLFHYCLNPGGLLFSCPQETLGDCRDLFAPDDEEASVYRRLTGPARMGALDFSVRTALFAKDAESASEWAGLKSLADALLQQFSPPAVLVNEAGDILYFSGSTEHFLELPAGQANWNIHATARAGLCHALSGALAQALCEQTRIVLPTLAVEAGGRHRRVQVVVQPVETRGPGAALIVFRELAGEFDAAAVAPDTTLRHESYEARRKNLQLAQQMHDLQAKVGSANEELQSINEELMATNEDLRSSNDRVQMMNDALLQSLFEREEARCRIETLSRRLVSVQELERRGLSAELHDRTSPNLAAMKIIVKSLYSALTPEVGAGVDHLLADLSALLDDTSASIREISADLRPPVLDHAGLLPALDSYAQQFSSRTGIAVVVETGVEDGPSHLSAEHQSVLFRIAQEALTNCAKHAQAQQVGVVLMTRGRNAILTIVDDGVGFAPEALNDPQSLPGLGLLTMRERAEFAGGRFSLDSRPGKGTRITVEIGGEAV